MTSKDFIITPLVLLLVYILAFIVRPTFTNKVNRRYFIPGLTVKVLGALAVGFVYQFYYGGGDTFAYFTHGASHVWEAFMDSPRKGLALLLANGEYQPEIYDYATKIWYYSDPNSYSVVKFAAIFSLFTFNTYSATAVFFAVFSFIGLWAFYISFYKLFPKLSKEFAIAIFFIPSVFFWGSGILKDTITIGSLGCLTYGIVNILFHKEKILLSIIIVAICSYFIFLIKIYIILCFIPAVIVWYFFGLIHKVKSDFLKFAVAPFAIILMLFTTYYAVLKVGEDNPRYSLNNLSRTAESTARWLSYVSEVEQGAGYTLGDFDYSATGMMKKVIPGIWVSLFRPYLWEVKNFNMLLSAIESLYLLFLTIFIVLSSGFKRSISLFFNKPEIMFCFVFSLTFAFAIGFSTYNFGSLVRYKIPLIPFYLIGLFLIRYYSKKSNNLSAPNFDKIMHIGRKRIVN